jgi:hypothetical protein
MPLNNTSSCDNPIAYRSFSNTDSFTMDVNYYNGVSYTIYLGGAGGNGANAVPFNGGGGGGGGGGSASINFVGYQNSFFTISLSGSTISVYDGATTLLISATHGSNGNFLSGGTAGSSYINASAQGSTGGSQYSAGNGGGGYFSPSGAAGGGGGGRGGFSVSENGGNGSAVSGGSGQSDGFPGDGGNGGSPTSGLTYGAQGADGGQTSGGGGGGGGAKTNVQYDFGSGGIGGKGFFQICQNSSPPPPTPSPTPSPAPSPSPSCVVAGTKLILPHEEKNVEEVAVGDFVLGLGENDSQYFEIEKIEISPQSSIVKLITKSNFLVCSDTHCVYSIDAGVFKHAINLTKDEKILTPYGIEQVVSVELDEPQNVYQIILKNKGSYYANNILSHSQHSHPIFIERQSFHVPPSLENNKYLNISHKWNIILSKIKDEH